MCVCVCVVGGWQGSVVLGPDVILRMGTTSCGSCRPRIPGDTVRTPGTGTAGRRKEAGREEPMDTTVCPLMQDTTGLWLPDK